MNHKFISPNNIFKPVVQVLACPLHSLFFVLCPDYLAVSAAVNGPAKNPPCSNNRTLGHVACSVHLHKLSCCSLVISLHSLLDHSQDFGSYLEVPATSWKTTKGSMVLVLLYCSLNSLFRYSVPFCSQDSSNVPVRYFLLKV